MGKYRKSLPYTTPEQFCFWLHEWIDAFNLPMQQRWGWSFPLDPPDCIDVVQGEPPYKIVVRRIRTDRRITVNLWNSQREKEYPRNETPPRRNAPQRRSDSPPYNPVGLEITISRVGKGIEVEVDCNDGHELRLEKFAFALMALEVTKAEPPAAQQQIGQHSDKRRVSRRQSNHAMRIKVGLVQWRNQKTGISIEDILAGGGALPVKSTYYEYAKEGLGYTSEDIESFGTSFGDLWASHNQGKLESAISAILDKLGRNSDETQS